MGLGAFKVSIEVLRGVEDSDESSIKTVDDFLLFLDSEIFFSSLSTRASSVAT